VPLLVKNDFHRSGSDGRDLTRESGLRLGWEHGRDVLEFVDLRVNRLVHFLVAMTDAHGKNSAEEVQILVAVGVPHILVLGACQHQRLLKVVEDGWEQALLTRQDDFVFSHVVLRCH